MVDNDPEFYTESEYMEIDPGPIHIAQYIYKRRFFFDFPL